MTEEYEGATPNEQLLFAARTDNEELLLAVFETPDEFDINYRDGLGNTALHYASQFGSTAVLEDLLSYEGCDVDLQNRLEHDTPLHLAVKNLVDPEVRNEVVESLLEAGADAKIKDKNGLLIIDLVSSSVEELDEQLRSAIRRAGVEASIPMSDIVDDEDEEEGEESDGTISDD